MTDAALVALAWICWLLGLLTGLVIRIGREKQAELRGIAIGRRQGRSQAFRRIAR